MRSRILQTGGAMVTALAVLLSTTLLAGQVRNSDFYSKSRLIRLIVVQDEVAIGQIVTNPDNARLLIQFAGALTSAYINFEMIPLGETGTFAAVFESVQSGVKVEKFEYHRKNLTIYGSAVSEQQYRDFIGRLVGTDYFENVSGHYYTSTDDLLQFQVVCASRSTVGSYLDFA